MSDDFTENKPKLPSHVAYNVQEGNDGKNYWQKVGAGWPTKGEGISLQLTAIPIDGRVELRPREELERMREERKQSQEQNQTQEIEPKP